MSKQKENNKKAKRIPNKEEIKLTYGYCLHLAGITDAEKILEVLLNKDKNIYFTHYVPLSWFNLFAKDFLEYASKQIDLCGWVADKNKIKKPKRKEPIWKHYEKSFLPAFDID